MKRPLTFILASVLSLLVACERPKQAAAPSATSAPSTPVTVFAAASTTDVLTEAAKRFEALHGVKVVLSVDASSNLAKQIKLGSPADVFISADQKWMDDVVAAKAVRADTRQDLLANELVMIAPVGRKFEVEPMKGFDFAARLPQVKRIALGDPSHVPAGRYAQQALTALGWWEALQPRLLPAQDVRAALRLVEIEEADAGIVYATDAKHSEKVVVVAEFPADLHDPIRYPVALCTQSASAAQFVEFLRTPDMIDVFTKAGFTVVSAAAPAGR
ncbi:MAG: molybdate ABC transporter substrate-binding protein [Phycisphaerales bacterium]